MTITTETTRAELAEAMTHIVASIRRLPIHYTDKRVALHAELDALLEEWLHAPA